MNGDFTQHFLRHYPVLSLQRLFKGWSSRWWPLMPSCQTNDRQQIKWYPLDGLQNPIKIKSAKKKSQHLETQPKPRRKSCHSESLVYVVSIATPQLDSLTASACYDITRVGPTSSDVCFLCQLVSVWRKMSNKTTSKYLQKIKDASLYMCVRSVCRMKPVKGQRS